MNLPMPTHTIVMTKDRGLGEEVDEKMTSRALWVRSLAVGFAPKRGWPINGTVDRLRDRIDRVRLELTECLRFLVARSLTSWCC
jgi:hypothetical protein